MPKKWASKDRCSQKGGGGAKGSIAIPLDPKKIEKETFGF